MPSSTSNVKVYFTGLNGMRFLAAFSVIIHHIEQLKEVAGLPNVYYLSSIMLIGPLAVTYFFVLSGFLITYLLLVENEVTQTISIRNFYIRRILRIWPLYYFIVLTGFFLLQQIDFLDIPVWTDAAYNHFGLKMFLFLTLFPNLALIFYYPVPYISHTWSIGVEEQFYLTWPVLMKYVRNHLRLLLLIVFVLVGLKIIGLMLHADRTSSKTEWLAVRYFNDILQYNRFGCMAIGGLGAYLLFYKKESVLNILYQQYFQISTYAVTVASIILGVHFGVVTHEIYSLLFCIIILNVSSNPKTLVSLENKTLSYLGDISYGIYMYHFVAIGLAMAIVKSSIENDAGMLFHGILYLLSIFFTIALSSLSYRFFEKPFLTLKPAFSKVVSGDEAKHNHEN